MVIHIIYLLNKHINFSNNYLLIINCIITIKLLNLLNFSVFISNDENDKETKLWLKQLHRPNETFHEVEFGMKSPLTENHLFTTPDHTLFIQNIVQGDYGIYICQGYETKSTDFQYIVDGNFELKKHCFKMYFNKICSLTSLVFPIIFQLT